MTSGKNEHWLKRSYKNNFDLLWKMSIESYAMLGMICNTEEKNS